MAGEDLARNTGVAEIGGAGKRGQSTFLDDEVNKVLRKRAEPRRGLADSGTQDRFEKGVAHCR